MVYRACIQAWFMWDASSFFEWLAARPWYTQILMEWVGNIPVTSGLQGLEVGCGPGQLTARVQALGAEMTGLDRSSKMVQRARRSVPECTFIEGDALALPLPDDSVDVAFAASVVNVVKEPQKLVSEMARVVKSGGLVSVLFPTPRLAQDASVLARRHSIVGLSGAALATWGGKAPKREPQVIEALLIKERLTDIRVQEYFDGTVVSITGKVP